MHIVSNIRNRTRFFEVFPLLAHPEFSGEECLKEYCMHGNIAHHWDLVLAKVFSPGATITEDMNGNERELSLDEWLIAPLIGRESTLGHSSILPLCGGSVGMVLDYVSTGGGLGISVDNPPGKGEPTKVKVMGTLCCNIESLRNIPRTMDFALDMPIAKKLCPLIAVVGSRSDAGNTTACLEIIKGLHQLGRTVGVAKLSGTMQKKEIQELAVDADQWYDMADAGLPSTYVDQQEDNSNAPFIVHSARMAAERIVRALSVHNDLIVAEFGGDLLSACVPQILADPSRLNMVALVMVAESATAATGMETILDRISDRYKAVPKYIVGPVANLQANRNRVIRETNCNGCFDLWSKTNYLALQRQRETSVSHARELKQSLLSHCVI